jgi:hypothetical protein
LRRLPQRPPRNALLISNAPFPSHLIASCHQARALTPNLSITLIRHHTPANAPQVHSITSDVTYFHAHHKTTDPALPMLQYAAPNASQTFTKPSSVFAEPSSRTASSSASQSFESHPKGYNDPRPPSSLPEAKSNENRHSRSFGDSDSSTALSQLASLAAQAPAAAMNPSSSSSDRYVHIRRGVRET